MYCNCPKTIMIYNFNKSQPELDFAFWIYLPEDKYYGIIRICREKLEPRYRGAKDVSPIALFCSFDSEICKECKKVYLTKEILMHFYYLQKYSHKRITALVKYAKSHFNVIKVTGA